MPGHVPDDGDGGVDEPRIDPARGDGASIAPPPFRHVT
jgi:hypothetical protein